MSAVLLQGCTRPGRQVTVATKSFKVASSICGSPVCNLLHVPLVNRSNAQKIEIVA